MVGNHPCLHPTAKFHGKPDAKHEPESLFDNPQSFFYLIRELLFALHCLSTGFELNTFADHANDNQYESNIRK